VTLPRGFGFLVAASICSRSVSRTIVERRDRAVGKGPLNTPLNRLMMKSQSSGDGKERRILAVTQQYTRPFNSARRFRSRPRDRRQLGHIGIADRQLDHPPPCHHDLRPPFRESKASAQGNGIGVNPTQMTRFMESMN
jgi:hypothetical protein